MQYYLGRVYKNNEKVNEMIYDPYVLMELITRSKFKRASGVKLRYPSPYGEEGVLKAYFDNGYRYEYEVPMKGWGDIDWKTLCRVNTLS